MAMKYSILLIVALAYCSQATLLTINGNQGDYCTRRYMDTTGARIGDWATPPGAAPLINDCERAPLLATTQAQEQPTSATTIMVPTVGGKVVTASVVECRGQVDATNPNTCLALPLGAGQTYYVAPFGSQCTGSAAGTIVVAAIAAQTTTITFPANIASNLADIDLEDAPRKLCYENNGINFWTGFYVAWYFSCTLDTACTAKYGTAAFTGSTHSLRTTCCNQQSGLTPGTGVCINPNVQKCCGNRGIELSLDKCCNDANEIVRYQWQQCPCWGGNPGVSCPANELCCQRTKFADFNGLGNPQGTCYNQQNTPWRCCNDGGVYNSGTHQCCSINGVQTKDVPCPCAKNDDCLGGQAQTQLNQNMFCCLQRFPSTPKYQPQCSAFTNYQTINVIRGGPEIASLVNSRDPRAIRDSDINNRPADDGFAPGRNLPQFQRCLGQCINTTYEICCNGARCYGQYERCCNATCCNKYLSSCLEHNRGSTRGSAWNGNDFQTTFAECTTIESMNALRAFWVYVVPTFLLVGTLTGFAIVVLFVINFTTRAYSLTEKALLVTSVIAILLGLPTFFSPIYKYGLVAVVTALLCILSASARVKWLNILAFAFTLLFILYLFDPFHGNNYLNVASLRQSNGNPWTWSSGVIYSIRGIWPGNQQINNYCTSFYHGYFQIGSRDFARWTNPAVRNFGYCDRGWATALLVFQGLQLLVSLWMVILTLLLLLLRFRKSLYEQIELEIVQHDY